MLDSERTIKRKVRSRSTVSNVRLRQQLFGFNKFWMETRLPNIFKTTNVTKSIKTILESPYKVLQITTT